MRSTPGQPVFRMRGVSKTYVMGEVEVRPLRAVDLGLYAGEFVVLLGASGSGKSTLLNILGGLDTPTAGTVWYLDHDLTGASDEGLTRFRREHVGFVFQFYNVIPSLTAQENVALVTEIADAPMDPARRGRRQRGPRPSSHMPSATPSARRSSWRSASSRPKRSTRRVLPRRRRLRPWLPRAQESRPRSARCARRRRRCSRSSRGV
jgi:ABC-type sugar transport system ATPase subunit